MNTRFVKTITTLAIISLLAAGTALAGNGKGAGDGQNASGQGAGMNGSPTQKLARLDEMFGLEPYQQEAILEFFNDREEQRQIMREQIQEAFGKQICEQRADNEGAFEKLLGDILSDEQLALHEEMKADREDRQANRRANRNGNGGIDCSLYEDS